MKNRNDIPNNIGEYVEYDETSNTGLRWKKTTGNRVIISEEAGYLNNRDYFTTRFNRKNYLNHRIIYFLHHGYCPNCIDHIDNDTTNNNIDNLREASYNQNNQNSTIRKDNSTGIKGLTISQNTHWLLKINKNRKVVFQKCYKLTEKSKDECRVILEEKRKEIHGSFANNG